MPLPRTLSRRQALRLALSLPPALLLLRIARHHRLPPAPADPLLPPPPGPDLPPLTVPVPEPETGLPITFPTPQTALHDLENPAVYMPTASGRVISAHYGSTRTNNAGRATFHEGTDIGPTRRDRRQNALDEIFAVADGTVAHINRIAGNSTYGIYVVLTHEEENFGTYYTLYAHLASVPRSLRTGQHAPRGTPIGIMGHTSSFGIPVQRAHLHFEVGLILNSRFNTWYRSKKRTPDHGSYHGHNLTGLDPLTLLLNLSPDHDNARYSIARTLAETPAAWSLAFHAPGIPDLFRRHPSLWDGSSFSGGTLVIDLSESGTPLRGRPAAPGEAPSVTRTRPAVLSVNPDVLGRNGRRMIHKRGSAWSLTQSGAEWLEILTYRA